MNTPESWTTKKMKYCAKLSPSCDISKLLPDSEVTFTPMECIRNGYFINRKSTLSALNSSYTQYQEGDIVIAKVTPCFENGNIAEMHGLYSGFGFGSSELFVLRPYGVESRFLFYVLQNEEFKKKGCATMTGTGGLKRVSPSFIENYCIALPTIEEQKRISAFLDSKCTEIDAVLEKTRASIEEYKKLKQAIITQAVTKGIRGDRPMKESGIDWVGKIPGYWNIRRIKTLFSLRDERNVLPLSEVNLISLYTDKGVVQHADLEKTAGNKASTADGYKKVYKNDIIVNIILCWMGAIGRSAYEGVTSPAYDIYVPSSEVECQFYHYYFRTVGFSGDCYKRGKGIMAMRWRTYSDQFRDIPVVFPPLEEQQAIVKYLDEMCAQMDTLIAKKEKVLVELESYKKSLIYEYVTGKKEVL